MSDEISDRGRNIWRGPSYAEMGRVTAVEDHDAWGKSLIVELLPADAAGRERGGIEARPVWPGGAGSARGVLFPVVVGDEVLVVLPAGDPNRALAIVGLFSGARQMPTWDGATPQVVHPNGLEVRKTQGAVVQSLVTVDVLPDLQSALSDVAMALAALGIPAVSLGTFLTNLSVPTKYRATALKAE